MNYPAQGFGRSTTRFVQSGFNLFFWRRDSLFKFHMGTGVVSGIDFFANSTGTDGKIIEISKLGNDLVVLVSESNTNFPGTVGYIYKMPLSTEVAEPVHHLLLSDIGLISEDGDIEVDSMGRIFCTASERKQYDLLSF